MTARTSLLIVASLSLSGCFAPEENINTDTDVADAGSSEGSGSGTSAPTTSDPTTGAPTTGELTTGEPTTGEPTTGDPTDSSTTDDPTMDPTSGGEDPFCGDGTVDPGEECDDGVDDNALDAACLPDCNLNVCGDGNLGPDEVCDDGEDDNILEVGACAPDCSRVIEEKEIRLGQYLDDGNLGANAVATADGLCDPGYRAMFVVPGQRVATTEPYGAEDSIDWVLQAFTYYVNSDGLHVWTTDATPLLGVRDGAQEDLMAPVVDETGQTLFDFQIISGLNTDWTASNSNTCNGWTSSNENLSARFGVPFTTSVPELISDFSAPCSPWSESVTDPFPLFFNSTTVYCIEQ